MAPSRFEHDTAVERLDDGHYLAVVDPGWAVVEGGAPNGGYLLALAARAMRAECERPDPVSVTAHFLAPPEPGEVTVEVEVVRAGRHATVAAALTQHGRQMVRLLGAFGDLSAAEGPTHVTRTPPPWPPPEDCEPATEAMIARARAAGRPPAPIFERLEHRTPPGIMGWAEREPTGEGTMGGWTRWADGGAMDVLGALTVADAYPPAVFNADVGPTGWVPTIELTVQVRKRPADGWLGARFTTEAVTAGYLEEDGEVWDADGDLVALSRQLALAARPRS